MTAVYKREFKSYFDSMVGYIFIAFMTAFTGIYFFASNLRGGYSGFSITLENTILFLLIGIPILTMRCLADERRSKTDQMLYTAPVKLWKIIMGKYLAMVTVFLIPVLISCLCPLILRAYGSTSLWQDYATILAFFLLGCVFIAIGMFLSSLTESLIISAVATFGVLLVMFLWYGLISFLPTGPKSAAAGFLVLLTLLCLFIYGMTKNWIIPVITEAVGILAVGLIYFLKPALFENAFTNILSKLAVTEVLDKFAIYHMFDIGGLIFYLSLIFIFIFLTIQSIQKRRWS